LVSPDLPCPRICLAQDAFVLDFGAAVSLTKDAKLGISYSGRFASGFGDHGLKANFNVKF
jgi:uncharacterized protein with beta-barrel porin domain